MSVRKTRASISTPSSKEITVSASEIKVNSAQNGLKKIAAILGSAQLTTKFDEILQIVKGPLRNLREKIHILHDTASADLESPVPTNLKLHINPPAWAKEEIERQVCARLSNFNVDFDDALKSAFDEELEKAQNLLKFLESTLSELDEAVEITSQRFLEEIKKGELSKDFILLQSCFEDCRNAIIFFKLKSKILKYFLCTAINISLEKFDPFSHWKDYKSEEENSLFYISKLDTVLMNLDNN